MEPMNYGIVGFGGIAENRIAKEGFGLDRRRFTAPLGHHLLGASDVNPEREQAAAALGVKWYHTYEQLLEDSRIHAVYVATSNSTHYETARSALLADKHVIIEKPMTTSAEQARDLMKIAGERSLSLSVNLMMSKNVYNRKARELIEKQVLGPVSYAAMHMEFLFGADPQEAHSWRCSSPEDIGGPVGDVGGHCLDMAEFLFQQRITSVRCVYYPETLSISVENGAFIQYTMEDGTEGCVRSAFNQPRGGLLGTLSNLGYEIYGESGVMRGYGTLFQLSGHKDEPFRIRLETETPEHFHTYYLSEPKNIYQAQLREHADSIRNNTPIDGSQGYRNLLQVLACHASARKGGKEVAVTDERP